MRSFVLVLAFALSFSPDLARAQSTLAAALAARYPVHELVPQSCEAGTDPVHVDAGRICVRDPSTGLVRAVRRVGLTDGDEGASAARSGSDVVFVVYDFYESAATRFTHRAWRWDLARDVYMGIAATISSGPVVSTPFGILYFAGSGPHLFAGGAVTRVSWTTPYSDHDIFVLDGTTYVARYDYRDQITHIGVLTLEGTTIVEREHAAIPGETILREGGLILTTVRSRAHPALELLRLPQTEPVAIPLTAGRPGPNAATRIDATTLRLTGYRTDPRRLDLGTLAITDETEPPAAVPSHVIRASSLRDVIPTASGVFLSSSRGGFVLDAAGGVARPRRSPPTRLRSRCTCDGTALVCPSGARTADACTEVQELDDSDSYGARSRATQYTPQGDYRIDRLEADLVRVIRLRDGARLWVRIFGHTLFAQTDDGAYFVGDRALEAGFAVRDGGDLLAGPLVPLATRATALYRATLVADFFAPP